MSADIHTSPPFYCPACGKKHRADLSALGDGSLASARVTCSRCEVVMSIFLGSDGLPKCEARARAETNKDPAQRDQNAQTAGSRPSPASPSPDAAANTSDSTDGVPMPQTAIPPSAASLAKGGLPLQLVAASLLAAALVGALVSFLVASTFQPDGVDQAAGTDAGLERVLERLGTLETRLAASEQALSQERSTRVQAESELRAAIASNATGLNAQGRTVTRMEQLQVQNTAVGKKIQDAYQGLHGRIERNYTQVSALKRQVDKLASK